MAMMFLLEKEKEKEIELKVKEVELTKLVSSFKGIVHSSNSSNSSYADTVDELYL